MRLFLGVLCLMVFIGLVGIIALTPFVPYDGMAFFALVIIFLGLSGALISSHFMVD